MICCLRVADISRCEIRHVATSTIAVFRMMLCSKSLSMAIETLCAKVFDFLRRLRREVRIVTCGAGHVIARRSLASALRQRFELTHGASFSFVRKDKVAHKIGKIIARVEVVGVLVRPLDCHVSFEMALHADLIASCSRQTGDLQHLAAG